MKAGGYVLAGCALMLVLAAVLVPQLPAGAGPSWQDNGPRGHSVLAQTLAQSRQVRVLEGSDALLPDGSGDGDVLFLFPSHRPASAAERGRVGDFVQAGGSIVVAADGGHAMAWFESLGLPAPHGVPLVLAPGGGRPCTNVTLPLESRPTACLPSPVSFPPEDLRAPPQGFRFLANTSEPAFLDLDLDGTLSLGDQGPLRLPVVLAWRLGGGEVVAISDGDLWRNGILQDASENLEAAAALADLARPDGTVYLDSTGSTQGALLPTAYRSLVAPTAAQAAGTAFLVVATFAATWLAPRARPLAAHRPAPDAEDPAIEAAAAALVRSPTARTPPRTDHAPDHASH